MFGKSKPKVCANLKLDLPRKGDYGSMGYVETHPKYGTYLLLRDGFLTRNELENLVVALQTFLVATKPGSVIVVNVEGK